MATRPFSHQDQAPKSTLLVLLVICAGALLIIGVTMVGEVQNLQRAAETQAANLVCGMSVQIYTSMPLAQQHRLQAVCFTELT